MVVRCGTDRDSEASSSAELLEQTRDRIIDESRVRLGRGPAVLKYTIPQKEEMWAVPLGIRGKQI